MTPKKDPLLQAFKAWELSPSEGRKLRAGQASPPDTEEFQITVPIFNYTINMVRDYFDGTNCSYLTYADDGKGGIHEGYSWDE